MSIPRVPNYHDDNQVRRWCDAQRYDEIVYVEEVWTGKDLVFYVMMTPTEVFWAKDGAHGAVTVEWQNCVAVEVFDDTAPFVNDRTVASYTRRLQLSFNDQVGSVGAKFECYTYFENSKLVRFLQDTWLHAKRKEACPMFYPRIPEDGGVPRIISRNGARLLVEDFAGRFAAECKAHDHTVRQEALEEMTVACAHRAVKHAFFESPEVLQEVITEIKTLSFLSPYVSGKHAEVIVTEGKAEEIEGHMHDLLYLGTLFNFLSKLLQGSECIEARVNLVFPDSTAHLMDLFNAILLVDVADLLPNADAKRMMRGIRAQSIREVKQKQVEKKGPMTNTQFREEKRTAQEGLVERLAWVMQNLDAFQAEIILTLFGLLEHTGLMGMDDRRPDLLLNHITGHEAFLRVRVIGIFKTMVQFLRSVPSSASGYYCYVIAWFVHRMVTHSTLAKEALGKESELDLKYEVNAFLTSRPHERQETALPQSSFFYGQAATLLRKIMR